MSSADHISYKFILKFTNNSKIFSQLLTHFREHYLDLFTIIVEDVPTMEVFNCVRELFTKINMETMLYVLTMGHRRYEISVPPPDLVGYQQILDIIGTSPSAKVRQ